MRIVDTPRWLVSVGRLSRNYRDLGDRIPGGRAFLKGRVGVQWHRDPDIGTVVSAAVAGLGYFIVARGPDLSHFDRSKYQDMRVKDALPAIWTDGYRRGRLDRSTHILVLWALIVALPMLLLELA